MYPPPPEGGAVVFGSGECGLRRGVLFFNDFALGRGGILLFFLPIVKLRAG